MRVNWGTKMKGVGRREKIKKFHGEEQSAKSLRGGIDLLTLCWNP